MNQKGTRKKLFVKAKNSEGKTRPIEKNKKPMT